MQAAKDIGANLRGLNGSRLAVLGAIGIGLVTTIFFGMGALFSPAYVPVYSELSPATASEMSRSLEGAGISVRLSADASTLSVPEGELARARMALADSGLLNEGAPGWEIFDTMSGMGMNSFLQRVNRLRALEGELARSVQTIEGIDSARVHLVLPEREAFSRERPEPSASVIVRARRGYEISRRQALAIRALVAAAVADLEGSRITILSASGETILAEDDGVTSDLPMEGARARTENRLARAVESILSARVGQGNVRVQVSADVSAEQERRVSRSFDPNQQVVRSVETRQRDARETDPTQGDVDAGNNIPAALQQPGGEMDGTTSTSSSTDEIVNYEIGSVESEVVRGPGDIDRLTVAVLVNGTYETDANGETVYVERSAEELERLAALVRSAVGFDEERGDLVSIDTMQFQSFEGGIDGPASRSLGATLAENAMSILRALFGLAAIALVMIFGARPLKAVLSAGTPALPPADDAAEQKKGADQATTQVARSGNADAEGSAGAMSGTILDPEEGLGDEDMVRLVSVEGAVKRRRLASVGQLVDKHPDDALRVLSSWLAEG